MTTRQIFSQRRKAINALDHAGIPPEKLPILRLLTEHIWFHRFSTVDGEIKISEIHPELKDWVDTGVSLGMFAVDRNFLSICWEGPVFLRALEAAA